MKLAVNVSDAHYDYGVLLGLQEQWDAAAEAYRQALALNPQHAQARNNLGQILERQQKLDEAVAEYQRAVDSQPTLRIARFNLGRMLIAKGARRGIVDYQADRAARCRGAALLFARATAHLEQAPRRSVKWRPRQSARPRATATRTCPPPSSATSQDQMKLPAVLVFAGPP